MQKEEGATKQREEDIHLDWAEEVTTHEEDQAEEMELSTDNLSEKKRAGRPDMTQYSLSGAARLDRIYISSVLLR